MARDDWNDILALATRCAQGASPIIRAKRGAAQVSVKADRTVVTDVDHTVQAYILQEIAAAYPEHAVIAEETVHLPRAHAGVNSARYCWVIDPLDGTRNFASGFACYATAIAVLDHGQPIVAVVVEHNSGTTFAAVRGRGATQDGVRIAVHEPDASADCLVGIPSSKDELSLRAITGWSKTKGLICRALGSASYHLALVAAGTFAGTFCRQCKIWDVAAGVLLVSEAGGMVTGPAGKPLTPFRLDRDMSEDLPTLAAAPGLHPRLLKSLSPTCID